jgi:hypothetical protein
MPFSWYDRSIAELKDEQDQWTLGSGRRFLGISVGTNKVTVKTDTISISFENNERIWAIILPVAPSGGISEIEEEEHGDCGWRERCRFIRVGARAFVDAGRDEFDRERTNSATHEITPETINVLGTNDGAYYPDGI